MCDFGLTPKNRQILLHVCMFVHVILTKTTPSRPNGYRQKMIFLIFPYISDCKIK